ncbi:MAG: acyltransferase domain-containing protein [Firmicutes bacterium]|nr:acyltransferase domain-containing protein [Bacillota bacterium]
MNQPIIFMFSGQGSQYYQMGRQLFTQQPVFRDWMLKLDDLARPRIGQSVVEEIYHPQKNISHPFDRTLYTHPAIFMAEYALVQVLAEMGIRPDYVLGASLGEYVAAVVANVAGVEDILDCVIGQAKAFEAHCRKGGMLAVLAALELYRETPLFYQNSELVAINYHSHFVVSGEVESINEICRFLKTSGIIHQLLPVSFGFHSACIEPAGGVYQELLRTKSFQKPTLPYISCVFGNQLTGIPDNYFWDVVRQPIQFQKAIGTIEKQSGNIYLDLGPSGTLTNFTKQNLVPGSLSKCFSIMTPFGQDLKNLEALRRFLGK